MSLEESRRLWCLLEGDPRPFDVFDVLIDANVARLKAKIIERIKCLHDTDPDCLKLWKLNATVPIDPDHGLTQRLAALGNINTYSTELSSAEKVQELFPEPPSEKHLHIVVRRPGIALSSPSVRPDRQCLSLLPSEVKLCEFRLALQVINASPDWYSNPHNLGSLPFPMLYSRLPTDRFPLSEPTDQEPVMMFEYMGRERFGSLWDKVQSFRIGSGFSQLFLHGNMGSGKSHMLAALACLLFRLGERPVYLPDCRQMLGNPLSYIQSAMLCSFADPSSLARRNKIRSFQNMEDALTFCGNLGETHLYFIVDQINALEQEETNADSVSNHEKDDLRKFLRSITFGHYSITSASANYQTFQRMAQKQTGEIKMSMMGGMSKAEMKQWWGHHEGKLPVFEPESDKDRVEDLTGRIPLLLQPLLGWKGQRFGSIEQQFWHHRELAVVKKNILDFDRRMTNDPRKHALYIDALFACLLGSVYLISAECFDHREGGAIAIRKVKPDKFLTDTWFNTLDAFEDNPVVVGFIVEQTCLSAMSSLGLNIRDLHWNPLKPKIFSGDLLYAISLETSQALYIPDQWNYKDIDALYVYIDKKTKTILIVPIQISINPLHKDSEACFYAGWQRWMKHFEGYTLSSTFLWIVEHDRSWKIVDEQLRAIRGTTQLIAPQHKQMHVTVGDVYPPLGERLEARARRMRRQSGQPSCKMIESARQNELEIVSEYFSEATEELFKNGEGSSKRKRAPSSRGKTRSNKTATPASRRMKQPVNDDDEC